MDNLALLNWVANVDELIGNTRVALIVAFVVAIVIALVLHALTYALLTRITPDKGGHGNQVLIRVRRLTRFAVVLLAVVLALPVAELDTEIAGVIRHFLYIGMIFFLGWASIAAINASSNFVLHRHRSEAAETTQARKFRTQLDILRRISVIAVAIATFGAILMTFPAVRTVGISLLASAGAAGIILGLASRPILTNIIAGVQIALTQPIRLEDVVIVEGEWGWIEEITTTYVVVRIWDLRRLILPLSYFVEKPFQNWTRDDETIIGIVTWNLDYRTPIDKMRTNLQAIVADNKLWDGRTANLSVIESDHNSIKIRAIVSARNSVDAWDLRCAVREQMIIWLQQNYPESLPRIRAEFKPAKPTDAL